MTHDMPKGMGKAAAIHTDRPVQTVYIHLGIIHGVGMGLPTSTGVGRESFKYT